MGISIKPRNLKRYRDLAMLLVRHARPELLPGSPAAEMASPENADAQRRDAERLTADLERLGPTFIKLGQLLSTRPDLLPEAYLEALSRLQDQVEPFPFFEVEEAISTELGVRLSKAFADFDPEPIAAASLAQVHRATMRDGRQVAVKVQRPGMRKQVADDLEALGEIAGFLDEHSETARRFQFSQLFDEFGRSLWRELDYRNEVRNMTALRESLAEFERIVIAEPVEDFCTSRVLTMDYLPGRKVTAISPIARLEFDGRPLAEELFRAYLKQILVDGSFHADPHPGNVLLTDDGRLALVDLGMFARLTEHTQENLLQLLMAIAEGRSDDAARLGIRIGTRANDFDEELFNRRVADLVAENRDLSVNRIEVGRTVLEVTRVSGVTGLRLPAELTLLGKALLNLDQVAWALDPDFNPTEAIRKHAPELVQRRLADAISPGNLFSSALEMREFVEQMPRRVNRIMDALASNDIRFRVDAIDETRLLAGMHRIANRITMGLVMSALIVGAALLMRVDTPFRILGYPGLAITCFLLAAGGGVYLLFKMIRDET